MSLCLIVRTWGGRPGGPEELQLARDLRVALHSIFSALARGGEPDAFSLARLRFAYAQAVAAPAENRVALSQIAGRARTAAATAWSVAAAQLDQINVDAGLGHQHVYLETEQGSGAFTADGEEEGHTGG